MPTNEKLPPDGYELGPGWRDTGTLPAPNVWKCMADVGDGRCCGLIAPYRSGGNGACPVHAEAMGAIVRKAEAPTLPESLVCLTETPDGVCAMRRGHGGECALVFAGTKPAAAESPAEQPSGNAGESGNCPTCGAPPPVRIMDRIAAAKEAEQPSRNPLQLPARIAALEAELAARIVERDGWMQAAAKSETEKTALKSELVEAVAHVNDMAEAYRRTLAAWERKYVASFAMLAEANAARRSAVAAAVQAERERCAYHEGLFHSEPWHRDTVGTLKDRIKNGDPKP